MSAVFRYRRPNSGLGNIKRSFADPGRNIDWVLMGAQGALAVIGLFVIYSASWSKFPDPFLFVTRQEVFLMVAIVAMVAVSIVSEPIHVFLRGITLSFRDLWYSVFGAL